jgi:two-component system LytT family sensor kinase
LLSWRESILENKWKRIIFPLLAFVVLNVVSFMMDPFDSYWMNILEQPIWYLLLDSGITLLFCIIVSEICIYVGNQLNRYIPWKDQPGKRLIIEVTCVIILVWILSFFFSYLFAFTCGSEAIQSDTPEMLRKQAVSEMQWFVLSAIVSLMLVGINTGSFLIRNWKNEAVRAAEMNQYAIEAELRALKLQIDPHFVFNNLSVLSELILEDQKAGHEFAENFSRIYRYILVNSKKDLTSLEEELKFLNAYIKLIKHRFGNRVEFSINVNTDVVTNGIPPLTLQLLVENALKHNKTVKTNPLKIYIYTNAQNELVVENTLAPIGNPLNSSKFGLSNIQDRYALLTLNEPQIIRDEQIFKVILPLIKL